jgi:hypothetical protein
MSRSHFPKIQCVVRNIGYARPSRRTILMGTLILTSLLTAMLPQLVNGRRAVYSKYSKASMISR